MILKKSVACLFVRSREMLHVSKRLLCTVAGSAGRLGRPGSPPSEDGMASEPKPKRQPKTEAVARPIRDATATSNAKPFSRERWAQQEAGTGSPRAPWRRN
jgi:hypothetical protein